LYISVLNYSTVATVCLFGFDVYSLSMYT